MSQINDFQQLVGLDDAEFVKKLYQILLRREPDPSGSQGLLKALRGGTDKRSVALNLALSAEGRLYPYELPGLAEAVRQHARERSLPFGPLFRIYGFVRRAYQLLNRIESSVANIERQTMMLPETVRRNSGSGALRRDDVFDMRADADAENLPVPSHLSASAARFYRQLKKHAETTDTQSL